MKYLGIFCRKPGKSVLCIVLTLLVVNASSVSLSNTKDAPLHVIEICNSNWAAGRQIVEYAAWDLTMMYPSTFLLSYLTHDEKLSDAHLRAKHISPEDAIPAVFINGKHAFYGRPSQGSGHHYHWRNRYPGGLGERKNVLFAPKLV